MDSPKSLQQSDSTRILSLAREYAQSEKELIRTWIDKITHLASQGKVALWGAGAKGTTFANLIDPNQKFIDCIVDLNPNKQGNFVPGTGHPIVDYRELASRSITDAILMNPKGRVIGVDIEIRPHNRQAIEKHELYSYITLIEGSSIDPDVVNQVQSHINPGEVVLVILDSNHSKGHVLAELNCYGELVTPGSYLVATDGIMRDLIDVPRGQKDWQWNNPYAAALEFIKLHSEFTAEQPGWPFNESELTENITHWPGAWLKRTKKEVDLKPSFVSLGILKLECLF